MATFDDIKSYYVNILQRDPSDDEVRSWEAPVNAGALNIDQVRQAFINSSEAQNVAGVIRVYQAAFGRVPDQEGLKNWVNSGLSMDQIAEGFVNSEEFTNRYGSNNVTEAFVTSLYFQVLGRAPDAEGLANWTNSGLSAAQILAGFSESQEFKNTTTTAVSTFLDNAGKGVEDYSGSLNEYSPQPEPEPEPEVPSQVYTLTNSVDSFTGTAGNDTFNANLATNPSNGLASVETLTALDEVDGGDGVDTLKYVTDDGVALPSASIQNIEKLDIRSGLGVTANVTKVAGLESVSAFAAGAVDIDTSSNVTSVTLTGAATTVAIDDAGTAATTADKLASANITGSTGAVGINSDAFTTLSMTNSGSSVTIGAAAGNRDLTIDVNNVTGGTYADAQATSVSVYTVGKASAGMTLNAAKATSVTLDADEALSLTDVNIAAAKSIVVKGDSLVTIGATSTVTALQSIDSTGSTGGVVITPVLGTAVTFTGGEGKDSIAVGATTKSISMGAGDDVVTMTAAVGTNGSVDAGEGSDTLKLSGAVAETVSSNDTFEKGISNFEKVEITGIVAGQTDTINLANLDDINYVVTAGTAATSGAQEVFQATFGTTVDADTVTFDGLAINLSANQNAIQNAAEFATEYNSVPFIRTWTALSNGDGTVTFTSTSAIDRADVTNASFAVTSGGNGTDITVTAAAPTTQGVTAVAGGAFALTNMLSNGTLELTGSVTAASSVSVKDAATNASDVVNIALNGASNIINTAALTLSSVETINISTTDSNKTADPLAASTILLGAADATAITVSGNHGVDFTGSTLSKVVSLNAYDVTATGLDATAIGTAGKVTFATAVTDKDVSIIAGNGDDVLSAASVTDATKVATIEGDAGDDVITGGAGKDVLSGGDGKDTITGGISADTLSGGAGNDTFVYTAVAHSTLANMDIISDFSANTYGNGTNGAAGTGAGASTNWTGDVIKLDITTILGGGAANALADGVVVSTQTNAADAQTFLQNLGSDATPAVNNAVGAALDSTTGRLYMDLDSNGTIDSVIQLTGVTTITASAFELV